MSANQCIADTRRALQNVRDVARHDTPQAIDLLEQRIAQLAEHMAKLAAFSTQELAAHSQDMVSLMAQFEETLSALENTKTATRAKMGHIINRLKANKLYGNS